MSLNDVSSGERIHIGFFGLRNAGKSSLCNALTGQELSLVSEVKGTTTDPVKKAMELLPLGPVVIIDTPGLDDLGTLGELRVKKALQILSQVDIAVIVADAAQGPGSLEQNLMDSLKERNIPCLLAYNKADLLSERPSLPENALYVSARTGENIEAFKSLLGQFAQKEEKHIAADLLPQSASVVLVIPIDEAAPKGRLILPQQLTIRDLLDKGCTITLTRETELEETLNRLSSPPNLVITDSQVFGRVASILPSTIPLTSFSVLFARYKGELAQLVLGAARLNHLQNGDKVLISEGCTHHRQCGDIGTVKLPRWIREYAHCEPEFSFTSGGDFPQDVREYRLVVHCGGCMLNEKEMKHRIRTCASQGVPIVNYGVAIAQIHGILPRSLQIFPNIQSLLTE